ncbi:AMP-binding protein [Nocardia sp. NPDC052566]|uniref:AMP-binding protein n=1 Tax=Nocardia sp. NPDC052566 TaxID=3364330 RepID=UPI0037C4F7DC
MSLRRSRYPSCGTWTTLRCSVCNSSVSPPLPFSGNSVDLLRTRSEDCGERSAFVFLDEEGRRSDALTYRELDLRARAVAHRLTGIVAPGERALLLHPPGLDYVAAYFGCLYAGVIAVPLFPPQRNKAEHVDVVARDCAASVVLSVSSVTSAMDSLDDALFVKGLPRIATDTVTVSDATAREVVEQFEKNSRPVTEVAYLQYTSGSTSTPKGVVITHAMVWQQCAELAAGWGVDADSTVVSWLPHFHDFGQVSSVLMPVQLGITSVLMAPSTFVKNPIRWLAAVTEYGGTHSGSPNFAFDLCVDNTTPAQRERLDLSSWRVVSNGAEPVRTATLERFRRTFAEHGLSATALTPGYGLAEATLKVTSGNGDHAYVTARFDEAALGRRRVELGDGPASTELVGCGRPIMTTEIAIVDPDTAERCGDDQLGEIWVCGPIVAPGYWRRPEESERTFRARIAGAADDRTYLRTGDLGFVHDGELYICGRVKNLMIVNGVNYYLEDIEATVVRGHDALRAGAVIAFSTESDGQENLVLVAEYRAEGEPSAEDLITVVHDAVARRHAIAPSAIVLIAAGTIPRTTSGKLRRQQCRADYLAGLLNEIYRWEGLVTISETEPVQRNSAAPGMPSMGDLVAQGLRTQIAEWIAQHMGPDAPRMDGTRSLTELGLGSVDQMNLHERLETWSGRRFPPELMWDAASIDEMTRLIAEQLVPATEATPTEVGA